MTDSQIKAIVQLANEVLKDLPTFGDLHLLRDELLELRSAVTVLHEQHSMLLKAIENRTTPN